MFGWMYEFGQIPHPRDGFVKWFTPRKGEGVKGGILMLQIDRSITLETSADSQFIVLLVMPMQIKH